MGKFTGNLFAGRRPRVIAHRGASGQAPENTMVAFDLAIKQLADIIELDVLLTQDCKVVVCHDEDLLALTGRPGKISEMEYSRLEWHNAGFRFTTDGGATFPYRSAGLRIPLLEDVLKRYPNTPLIVELKSADKVLASKTLDLLRKFGRIADGSAMVTSFEAKALKHARHHAPDALTGCSKRDNVRLFLAAHSATTALLKPRGCAYQLPVKKYGLNVTSARTIAAARKLGLEVHSYTVNEKSEMERFIKMDVDGIFTDYPHRLRWLINSRR